MQNSSYPFIPPSSTFLSEDLLFFDTFSHSGSEKDNFDLVQFPTPVIIDLIKIVPLGQPVEAKIPGNVRLGATNPSKCELEFFINDLSRQDAHTMTDLGKFYCTEKTTDFSPPLQIQTDGLLLRGSYRTLTLAIFGQIASFEDKIEDEILMSATSPPAQTPASPVASERDNPYAVIRPNLNPEVMKTKQEESELYDELPQRPQEALIENNNILMDQNPSSDMLQHGAIGDIVDIAEPEPELGLESVRDEPDRMIEETSNSETGAPTASYSARDKRIDEIEYSNSTDIDQYAKRLLRGDSISSRHTASMDKLDVCRPDKGGLSDDLEIIEWTFDAARYRPKPLVYFADPSLTLQERNILAQKLKASQQGTKKQDTRELEKVRDMFDVLNCPDDLKTDDWVTLIEDLTNDLSNISLSLIVSNEEMLKFLVAQVCHGLDINLALKQKQTGFRVRHIRAGLKLANIMFHCGELAVRALLDADVPKRILELYEGPQMSLPLRLLICRCLNTVSDTVEGVEYLISRKCLWTDSRFSLSHARKLVESKYRSTSKTETTEREENQTTFEPVYKDRDNGNEVVDNKASVQLSISMDQRQENDKVDNQGNDELMTCYQIIVLILLSQPTTRITLAFGNLSRKIRLYLDLSKFKLSTSASDEFGDSEDSVFHSSADTTCQPEQIAKNITLLQNIVNLTKDGCLNIAQPIRFLPAKVQFQMKRNPSDIYLAIYKWLKHFKTLHCLNIMLSMDHKDSMSSSEIEQSNKLQGLCIVFIQQILNFPRGIQFLLSDECCDLASNLISTLAEKHNPTRSSHLTLSGALSDCIIGPNYYDRTYIVATCHDLSSRMAYNFKVFSCIDRLFHFHREMISKRSDVSVSDPERILHQLYVISDHPHGLDAIVKHFSHIGNLDCLLRFLDLPENNKQLEFVKETSIDYVLELVGAFFRLNNNVLEIADEYLDTLTELCKTKDKNLSTRVKSLLPWLNPFDTDQASPLITYNEETFKQLTRVIRKSIPNYSIPFAKELDFELPPQMITAVRILRQLCIPPQVESYIKSTFDPLSLQKLTDNASRSSHFVAFVDSMPNQQNHNHSWNLNLLSNRFIGSNHIFEDSMSEQINQISNTFKLFQPYEDTICGELKYHYGIIQVHEQEGLRRLLNTLRELTGNYPRPVYQSAALSGFRGRIVISYINSVIVLLHSLICHLIDARGSEFRDTSVIPVILETYSLLCFVPVPEEDKIGTPRSDDHQPTPPLTKQQSKDIGSANQAITLRSDNHLLAQQTKKLILSILMSYSQMCLSVSESEEKVISKSMWTKMLKEVIDFTLSAPVFFHHGLDVLTKLLPSPLPCSNIMDSIDQEQLFKNINHRKLWSAHLHPLHQQIERMISNLCISYQSNIRALLYYLCNQLCDLSSNAACMVAKIITDSLIIYASKLHRDTLTELNSSSPSEHTAQQQPQQQQPSPKSQQQQQPQSQQPQLQRQSLLLQAVQLTVDATDQANSLIGPKESTYAVKMILNLLSNLITNQAFETAFTNHLQMIGKKDERLLASIKDIVTLSEDYKSSESIDDSSSQNTGGTCGTSVSQLIESIKAINNELTKSAEGYTNTVIEAIPPEEMVKINLIDLSRKISDRSFALHSGLAKTYRLKVLLDLNVRAHNRTSESATSSSKRFERGSLYGSYQEISVPSSHRSYVAPLRGRGRSAARPDSFRSRPQNTSRPPSIHVDDFVDLYGDPSGQSVVGRYPMVPMSAGGAAASVSATATGSGSGNKSSEYRATSIGRASYSSVDMAGESALPAGTVSAAGAHRNLVYYGMTGVGSSSAPRSGSPPPYSSRSSHSRARHMK